MESFIIESKISITSAGYFILDSFDLALSSSLNLLNKFGSAKANQCQGEVVEQSISIFSEQDDQLLSLVHLLLCIYLNIRYG